MFFVLMEGWRLHHRLCSLCLSLHLQQGGGRGGRIDCDKKKTETLEKHAPPPPPPFPHFPPPPSSTTFNPIDRAVAATLRATLARGTWGTSVALTRATARTSSALTLPTVP